MVRQRWQWVDDAARRHRDAQRLDHLFAAAVVMALPVIVALLQMDPQGNDQQANLDKADMFCRRAAVKGADIALMPEMWNIGYQGFSQTDEHTRRRWQAQALRAVGFTRVRVSHGQSIEARAAGMPVSMAIKGPKLARGKNKRAHSTPAFEKAKDYRTNGVNAKVCPAVSGSAKCGQCTMCADNDVAIIIYPMH